MTGMWRSIYFYMNWNYYDKWDSRQQHLKFQLNKQILKSELKLKHFVYR